MFWFGGLSSGFAGSLFRSISPRNERSASRGIQKC